MKTNRLFRLVSARSGLHLSGSTKVGLIVGAAVVIGASAVSVVAGTSTAQRAAVTATPPSPSPTPGAPLAKVPGAKAPQSPALKAPAVQTAASAAVADSLCTTAPIPATCGYDIWALAGSVSVPGYTGGPVSCPVCVPTWAFAAGGATAAPPAPTTLPGMPPITAVEGQALTLTLHNQLPAAAGNISLEVTAQSVLAPDQTTGIGNGASKAYPFPAAGGLAPGTYILEAGATVNGAGGSSNGLRQQAMGLTAMLIVRPKNWSPTCHSAYDETVAGACNGTPFTAESPVQYSELSTAFNNNPATGDLAQFKPDVFMVNGRSFDAASPTAGSIAVSPGDKLLLRHANLGIRERSISIGSARMLQLASDSSVLSMQPDIAALYINPVQSSDTLTTINPTVPLNTLIPIYDQGHNMAYWTGGVATDGGGVGGMMAMINVANGLSGTTAGPRTAVILGCGANAPPAPCVDDLSVDPAANDQLTVAATITPTNGAVTASEWFLDRPGDPGTGTPLPASSPCPAWAPAAPVGGSVVCFTIDVTTLTTTLGLHPPVDGAHSLWVHAQDANGWGVVGGDSFDVNFTGPLVTNVSVHNSPTNGSRANDLDGTTNVDILGRASSSLNGWVVTDAEVCIDTCTTYQANPAYDQGAAVFGAFTSGQQLNLVSTTTTQYVSAGATSYTSTTAVDASNGMAANGYVNDTITAATGETGTIQSNTASTVTLTGPWNGGTPAGGTAFTITGPAGANDPAGPMVGINGAIPAAQIQALTEGAHTLYIHACEAPVAPTGPVTAQNCGRWNDSSVLSTPLVVDKTAPATSGLTVVPDPNNGFQSGPGNTSYLNEVRVTATFTDPVAGGVSSPIAMAEAFISQPGHLPECYVGPNTPPLTTCPAQSTIYGTGAEMVPVGGKWNQSATQTANAFIPLADIRAFPEGQVWIWVHGEDLAGNWTPMTLVDTTGYHSLTLDKTPPVVDSVTATKGATTTAVVINAHDPINSTPKNVVQTPIVRAEWFAAPCAAPADLETCFNDPGVGNGTAIPVPTPATTVVINGVIPNQAAGVAVYIRVMDQAGNWSAVDWQHPSVKYP